MYTANEIAISCLYDDRDLSVLYKVLLNVANIIVLLAYCKY